MAKVVKKRLTLASIMTRHVLGSSYTAMFHSGRPCRYVSAPDVPTIQLRKVASFESNNWEH